MAIKTVSFELDAYDRLVRARRHPKESFSSVVRRAQWEEPQYTGRALLGHLRERIRRGLALSDLSLKALSTATGRKSAPRMLTTPGLNQANAYLVDSSFLLELEMEVVMITEGPAIHFVASHEASVYRVSIVTYGEFIAGLGPTDVALGNQILSRFELSTLSPVVAERYARESDHARTDSSRVRRTDNDVWVGCTAVSMDAPLLTRRADRFAGIEGLQTISLG